MCDCLRAVNEELKAENVQVDSALLFAKDKVNARKAVLKCVPVKNPRGKPTVEVTCTYCPFCGERYTNKEKDDDR